MALTMTAYIERFEGVGFVAWVENIKGLVVQGDSIPKVWSELLTSLKVKIAFDYNLNVSELERQLVENPVELQEGSTTAQKEISFSVADC